MAESKVVYRPRDRATPESELSALVAAYRYVICDCHASEKAPALAPPTTRKGSIMTAPAQKLYRDSSSDSSTLPVTFTGNGLRDKELPPVKWAIPDLLPAGVTLFGGREKMGKSWLGLSLVIDVATGGYALGKIPVEQGDALYLSLEDPERRLYNRVRRLARQETDLARFHYATKWNAADRGGVEHLDAWLEEHPACRLVVGDTLKRIRPRTSGRRNMYDEDYEAVQPFVGLAAKHNVAIVLIHHLNQQAEPHDPFDAFSGSAGLTAAAEGIWLLTRKRGDADAYLMVDGKDIEEPRELALGWDGVTCTWMVRGDAETYRLNKERREIVELLEREDEPMGPKEVADALGRDHSAVRQMMSCMHKDGQLKQEGYGKYVPSRGPRHTGHSSHASTNGSGVTGVTTVTSLSHEDSRHDGVDDVQQALFSGKRDSEQKSLSDREGVVVELQTDNISSSLAARSAPREGVSLPTA
jgi:AAA domain/IclR helix-turn-helix domain